MSVICPFVAKIFNFEPSFPAVSSYFHRRQECIMRLLERATFNVCTLRNA